MKFASTITLLVSCAAMSAHVACSTPAHAQERPADDSAAVGGASSENGYYAIAADVRRCASPSCGGWFLEQLNQATTTCHDGRTAQRCYTPVLDWSSANVPEAQQSELLAAARASTAPRGVRAVVRGAFAPTNSTTPRPELGRFVVTEAWVADGDGEATGTFVHVQDNRIRCLRAPCPNLTEEVLNLPQTTDIAQVDFAPAGLTVEEAGEYTDAMYGPDGVLVAGDRYTVQVNGSTATGRTATQAYRRLAGADSSP